MELRHLRYMVAIAEEGHLTRAARRLGMQQPPLSQQLRALEHEVGTPLFQRLPRGMALTAAGEVFLAEARAVLEGAERSVVRTRLAAAGQIGRVVVGVTTSALLHPLVPSALGGFHRAHPAVALDIREANAADLTEALLRREVDAMFLRAAVSRPLGLAFHELLREGFVVVLPQHHALDGRCARLGQFRDERFVLVRRPGAPGMYAQLLDSCRSAGFEPVVAAEVGRMLTAVQLVAAGIGITVVPASIATLHLPGVGYATLAEPGAPLAPLTVAHREDDGRPVVAGLLDAVRRAVMAHGGDA